MIDGKFLLGLLITSFFLHGVQAIWMCIIVVSLREVERKVDEDEVS